MRVLLKVLLMGGDLQRAEALRSALVHDGHTVDVDGPTRARYDVAIVDVAVPSVEGRAACVELRAAVRVPAILMLSDRAEASERIAALDAGADDFLGRPFALVELLARVRALGRRRHGELGLDAGAE